MVMVVAFIGSGLSFEAESEGRDSALERERVSDEGCEKKP
jgi:hypothetical protein